MLVRVSRCRLFTNLFEFVGIYFLEIIALYIRIPFLILFYHTMECSYSICIGHLGHISRYD